MKNSDFIKEMERRFNDLEGFTFQQFSLYQHLKQMQAEGKDIDKNYDGEELFKDNRAEVALYNQFVGRGRKK